MTTKKAPRQVVVFATWVPNPKILAGGRFAPVDVPEKPKRVWTLIRARDPQTVPALPIVPHHLYNAFLEDISHDWNWRAGKLHYNTRVADSGTWILLEY